MAFIDYGALLKVNGKFINKNEDDIFMKCSDTGYICDKANYTTPDGITKEININGNFYAYAGDENFLLCFYKNYFCVIHNNEIIKIINGTHFISETYYIDNFPTIKIEHLDKNIYYYMSPFYEEMEDPLFKVVEALEDETKINKLSKKYGMPYRTDRWKVTWNYNNNHYEVIFGYGIDSDEEVWNSIKYDNYDFTDVERNIIDGWFSCDS